MRKILAILVLAMTQAGCIPDPVVYPDADGDGWRGEADCDDADATVHPDAEEVDCNAKDDDCEPGTKDVTDADADGFDSCDADEPGDTDGNPADCDDENATTWPGGQDLPADGEDNDCDGTVDEPELLDETLVEVHTITGEHAFDGAGLSMDVGDLDGDGLDDLVIGAPEASVDVPNMAGVVYVVMGSSGGLPASLEDADHRLPGDTADLFLGKNVSIPGDLDGDDCDDLLVVNNSEEALWLYHGSPSFSLAGGPDAIFTGWEPQDGASRDMIRSAGDLDGDGDVEWLVGEPLQDVAYLLEGRTYTGSQDLAPQAVARFHGTETGYAVLGDVDLGGTAAGRDFVFGAANRDRVDVFIDVAEGLPSGDFGPPVTDLDPTYVLYGQSLAALGDLDGDGLDEFAVGSLADQPDDKRVYIYLGRDDWQGLKWDDYDASFLSPGGHNVGRALLGGLDLDADGKQEMVIGDPQMDLDGQGDDLEGAFFVLEAGDVDWAAHPEIYWNDEFVIARRGAFPEQRMGWSLARGDLDGDGADELVVASPGTYSGELARIHIYSLGSW